MPKWTMPDLDRIVAELFPPDVIDNMVIMRRESSEPCCIPTVLAGAGEGEGSDGTQ